MQTMRLEEFDREGDRHNPDRAAKLFELLWPDRSVRGSCENRLVQSIRFAHGCAPASWEVTMFDHRVRLNVGQVEVLTLSAAEVRFIFASATAMSGDKTFSIDFDAETPVYAAVPHPSGVCRLDPTNIRTVPIRFWEAHEAYIAAAADIKKVSPFKKSFSPAVLEYLERSIGQRLPRPDYWIADDRHRRRPAVSSLAAKQAAVARMAATARDTVAGANGQQVLRTLKHKDLRFTTLREFKTYIEALVNSQNGRCAITGLPLQFDGEPNDPELSCSLDRIDSNGHYEDGNLQVVCRFINRWKNDGKDAEFRRLIDLIRCL